MQRIYSLALLLLAGCQTVENQISSRIEPGLPQYGDSRPTQNGDGSCEIKTSDGSNACARSPDPKVLMQIGALVGGVAMAASGNAAGSSAMFSAASGLGSSDDDDDDEPTVAAGDETTGTWECKTPDGISVYGKYGMTSDSRFVRSTCRKVNNY